MIVKINKAYNNKCWKQHKKVLPYSPQKVSFGRNTIKTSKIFLQIHFKLKVNLTRSKLRVPDSIAITTIFSNTTKGRASSNSNRLISHFTALSKQFTESAYCPQQSGSSFTDLGRMEG
uniref:Uncharacterized protein n=1 Tax=Micrurus corallinus TaxID=54390 RepID=A0A2D4GRY2_MICCO